MMPRTPVEAVEATIRAALLLGMSPEDAAAERIVRLARLEGRHVVDPHCWCDPELIEPGVYLHREA